MAIKILGEPWNPVTGCTKISPGCRGCYAERFAERMQADGVKRYANGFRMTLHPDVLELPLRRKKPQTYFVNSMSDLYQKDVPRDFIKETFAVMNRCPQHTFQILTKRSDILALHAPHLTWSENVWQGVSVENQDYVYRIDDLRKVPAKIRFIYFEPLIGPITNLKLDGIHWAVVGGESGPRWRPIDAQWVRDIRDACVAQGVKFFFKQYAGFNPEPQGRDLDGKQWSEKPK
jgi:protein gp37